MKFRKFSSVLTVALGLATAGVASAAVITVSSDIAVSTTWTSDNTYDLSDQIYVLPGATLTIEPGTVIASTTTPGGAGSLAVTRGAQIFVQGTASEPVIMTSSDDVATWTADASHPTGGDPTTGTWREAANEWGNLTIMGNALISNSFYAGNDSLPEGNNESAMEGLVASGPGDTRVLYGGNDDDDDSGTVSYLSLRYGGRVVGLANELNGVSLGGIGRGTDIHHIDIMNNVDDGIEIFGGTVNLKYVNIWNIGDDSFDIDQGWRGKAQFGLIVQGYSVDANQGSGVGDNIFETDGAEDSDAQPVTTGVIYNMTAVGQPLDGDRATAWRDGARMQYRNCIFMECGEEVIGFDNVDGDGSNGYGFNGTMDFADLWSEPYTTTSAVNIGAGNPATLYTAQTSGTLCEMSGNVFYGNGAGAAYTNTDLYGVTTAGGTNAALDNIVNDVDMPITALTRGGVFTSTQGKDIVPVTQIDPRPANDALTLVSASPAPNDGFFTPASYRGGFAPDQNWLVGWTAADAFGFVAAAPSISVTSDIAVSETWTADKTYNLADQIYVLPGATLTIEPGTVIASTPTVNGSGSLAVCRGAQIYVQGTKTDPVIMTSTDDVATWTPDGGHPTGGDPTTGTWRAAANEWGNLSIMGNALISNSFYAGNDLLPEGNNVSAMEGLVASGPGDTRVLYGGNDDDDDSGTITYLSLRYGGRVVGLANELNGMSLGGIGRGTEMHHIDIMNNVDDGIEIFGGTVNLKYCNIWNIGDDSFDIDQGWRGKAQFGLIVQGYSVDANQGSGVGDNIFETDGAEDSDAQPVTTGVVYNFTAVGQPLDGDRATAWRDGARMQYRNCIFMECGEEIIGADNVDGDGSNGYGFNGTASFASLWTEPYTTTSAVNIGAGNPATLYTAQTSGTLCEMSGTVFYGNLAGAAYTNSDTYGVTTAGGTNVALDNIVNDVDLPIRSLTRGAIFTSTQGKDIVPVTQIDPRPDNDALTLVSASPAPNDGFFTPANYRGGFAPAENWLLGWTAADAFGYVAPNTGSNVVTVSTDIAVSETWTADNVYDLSNQVYVLPGATLTIEPGTVIASTTTPGGAGSLAVTRGAQIFVQGTVENPVIMTSTDDVATWTDGNPKTGVWREAANEWGNLTIMGNALISNSFYAGNDSLPEGNNESAMEGLVASGPGDTRVLYGGNDDDDDSGSVTYLSLRYGGRVVGLANELNGMSLGGLGRGTDIHHIDIMNNVDDGIEIFGGTVNLKYVNIWNIGDDSFDIDQGWRGKAQFGLIVQGYSVDANQGSGVGDNIFETDGAEDSDAQPVTTGVIYNMTAVGQPLDGDRATAWRDGARLQYRNCIFMDCGEEVVGFDNVDGDGSNGYGFNGTMDFADLWTEPYTTTSAVNIGAGTPATLYQAQTSGTLCEISDSVFFRNLNGNAYTNTDTYGVTIGGGDNATLNNVVSTYNALMPDENMPIVSLTRGTIFTSTQGKDILPVTQIDPRPANDAYYSVSAAPADGFFTPAYYRGGFAPTENWLLSWTAADAFGFVSNLPASVTNWESFEDMDY